MMELAVRQILWKENKNAWIEGKDTWVNLGYVPTSTTKAEFEFCICGAPTKYRSSSQPSNWSQWIGTPDLIIGHMGTSDSNDWRLANNQNNNGWLCDVGSARVGPAMALETNKFYHCIIGTGCKIKVDSDIDQSTTMTGSIANSTIKLFSESPTCTSSNTSSFYAWLGFKYVKIFENDTLVMDLIPAKKEGIACFYDKISTNAFFGLNNALILHN